ncbi:hypothetical protein APHAL10511_004923 [Amanita phalloides]|nr:hypothetical protein APHAL10511_004923 [Amanita phalloides]
MTWLPKRSLSETDAILCAPGNIHEVETKLISGRLLRVYKNLWPTLRDFWLTVAKQHSERVYLVFEDERFTYHQIHSRAAKLAAVFKHKYDIQKGDRVGICSKNCPDFVVAFWACHLIGAISVLINAWLPLEPLKHCIVHTACKLLLVDVERADRLEPVANLLAQKAGTRGFLVFNSVDGKGIWIAMECLDAVLHGFRGEPMEILISNPGITPEDHATIMFTSGTTGLPKGVLSTQRQFLTNIPNVLAGSWRAALRRGDALPLPRSDSIQKGALIAVPLFHVTGTTSYLMMASMNGMKIVLARKWQPEEAARLIRTENVVVAGGVPTMVSDIMESSLAGYPLEGLLFGGSPAPPSLVPRAQKVFPTALMTQGYGMTETNSIAVSIAGEDYTVRPASTGLPSPVNEVKIVLEDICLPPSAVGEVWLRGPNVMTCYWNDPVATSKAITADGWIKTGDLGYLDEEGFVYIKDRLKDIIIRGGENIDSVSIENALYTDPRVLEAAAVGIPDDRLGELVAAVVSLKPAYHNQVSEAVLMALTRERLPRFAVPVIIVVQNEPLGKTYTVWEGYEGAVAAACTGEMETTAWVARAARESLILCLVLLILDTINSMRTWDYSMNGQLLLSYISQFRLHLAHVQAHLAGETDHVLPPSFIPPAGYWTSSEKDSFFRALARYSRIRPDLIAAHIKTKSVVDVCAYIDQLHAASKANPIPWTRKDIDIAFEVSDSWVEFEERNASSLVTAEPLWDDEQCRTSRQAEEDKKRRDLTPDTFDNWRMDVEDQWNRQDSLKCLDTLQLNILESILRTGDPSTTPANDAWDNGMVDYQISNESPLDLYSAVTNPNTDPSPLSIPSSPSNLPATNTLPSLPNSRSDDVQPAPQTPARTADQTPSLSTSPRDRLIPNSPTPRTVPKELSPASRRRLQKRLYMRRKRAERSGGEVNYAAARLPPGRERHKTRSEPKVQNSEEHGIEQIASEKRKKGGMTRPHRIRRQFEKQGIDLPELQRIGLGLFHLSTLGGLIELYKFGYTEAEEDIITSISADTTRLLTAVVIDFMTEIIHRAIVFKNQEFRRKGAIKAWRLGQKEISGDDIYSCLEMMGLRNLTKKTYFEQLLRYRSDSDAGGSGAEGKKVDHGSVIESEDANRYLPTCVLSAQDTSFFTNEDDTSLMPMDTDERPLLRELAEEEELQQLDETVMKQHTSKLRQLHSK